MTEVDDGGIVAPFEKISDGPKYAQLWACETAMSSGVERMKHTLKRDWEMARIFLILAILTIGFVWGVRSLTLAPSARAPVPIRTPSAESSDKAEDQGQRP